MSKATEELRTLFNDLATGEEINAEVKSKVALALDTLVDIETEVRNAEEMKDIESRRADDLDAENKRLREYNSQLTMKLGTAVAVSEEKSDDIEEKDDDIDELDDIIEDYEMR